MAGRRLLGANGKFITPNNKKASVAAVVASNNENLFKLIASEKSHISQVNSATPDFNTPGFTSKYFIARLSQPER